MTTNLACAITRTKDTLTLSSPAFAYTLNIAGHLRSASWTNRITGRTLRLGERCELEVDADDAEKRIPITGWKGTLSQTFASAPDRELGYTNGYFDTHYRDEDWTDRTTPIPGKRLDERYYYWARTRLFLAEEDSAKDIHLVLGGVGLYDFRYMRVFVNGVEAGTRVRDARWDEPGQFRIGADEPLHRHLRFGTENVIALQLTGLIFRTAELDEVDPDRAKSFTLKAQWPFQFEQYAAVGGLHRTLSFRVREITVHETDGGQAEVEVELDDESAQLGATVRYAWNADEPLLRRSISLHNKGDRAIGILQVRLGEYAVDAPVSDGEQGFPVYIAGERYVSLEHPAGWTIGRAGRVLLRQYPGMYLQAGGRFDCMTAVWGNAGQGQARESFLRQLERRMRRTVRGHDRPLTIFSPFGGRQPEEGEQKAFGLFTATEAYLLEQLDKLDACRQDGQPAFEYYCLDFWHDIRGDLTQPDPREFPNGLGPVAAAVRSRGMKLGMWIDSAMCKWSIGHNPLAQSCKTTAADYGTEDPIAFCRATEPIQSMYRTAFIHHIREHGLRLLKVDNFQAVCYNPNHDHLPGIYSTEAIMQSAVDFLAALDRECPDLFLMLYWGYRSPWWLLHADTLFESGLIMESAHPAQSPTLYVRDSTIQAVDQGTRWCGDIPAIGKDSLGVWLSDWKWNSSIGSERWQEGMVMDMGRGHLLVQPWSNKEWLSADEWQQLAEWIAIQQEHADCFANAVPIAGNPWRNEAYGYCCGNGERAFLSLNNAAWSDAEVALDIAGDLRLAAGRRWQVYRHYPNPAQLTGGEGETVFRDRLTVALRPFEVALLEIVRADLAPAGAAGRQLGVTRMDGFAKASREIPVRLERTRTPSGYRICVSGELGAGAEAGMLVVTCELHQENRAFMLNDSGAHFRASARLGERLLRCEPVVRDRTFETSWQAWRMRTDSVEAPCAWQLDIELELDQDVSLQSRAYCIPDESEPICEY